MALFCSVCGKPTGDLPGRDTIELCEDCEAKVVNIAETDQQYYARVSGIDHDYDPPTLQDRIISYIEYEGFCGNIDPQDYLWSIDLSFDPKLVLFSVDTEAELWELFEQTTVMLAGLQDNWPDARPGEQYYDRYWGWWSNIEAQTKDDFGYYPVVVSAASSVFKGSFVTWDGWHRLIIARLARIKAVPVIKGILK